MQGLSIGLAIVLFSLTTACGDLALTRSPASTSPDISSELNQPELNQSESVTTEPNEPANQQEASATESEPSARLVEDLKSVLSVQTGIASHDISFVSAEAVDWPDACLGLAASDELCAQVITPGYQVILGTLDRHYEVHTDRSGRNIRIGQSGVGSQ